MSKPPLFFAVESNGGIKQGIKQGNQTGLTDRLILYILGENQFFVRKGGMSGYDYSP